MFAFKKVLDKEHVGREARRNSNFDFYVEFAEREMGEPEWVRLRICKNLDQNAVMRRPKVGQPTS